MIEILLGCSFFIQELLGHSSSKTTEIYTMFLLAGYRKSCRLMIEILPTYVANTSYKGSVADILRKYISYTKGHAKWD